MYTQQCCQRTSQIPENPPKFVPYRLKWLYSDMIFLLSAILCNTSLGILFRKFGDWRVDMPGAIALNYVVCALLGFMLFDPEDFTGWYAEPWAPWAAGLGLLFLPGFYIAARCVAKFGVGLTALMQKISLVVTACYAILFYGEPGGALKWVGIALAVLAIVLVNRPGQATRDDAPGKVRPSWLWLLPLATFSVNGLIDTGFYTARHQSYGSFPEGVFATVLFCIAGVTGLALLIVRLLLRKGLPDRRTLVAGLLLGIPNFFSIYLLLLALDTGHGGSVVFPVFNTSVIVLSALTGLFVFREKFSRINYIGFALACLAIACIALSR